MSSDEKARKTDKVSTSSSGSIPMAEKIAPSDRPATSAMPKKASTGVGEPRDMMREVPPLTGLAVVSLVFGILSLVTALLLLPAVGAIFAGHLAIHKIRHAHEPRGGHRLAVTGLIMGYVSVLMFSVLVATFFLLWPRFGPMVKDSVTEFQERRTRLAMRHASELFLVCERYARDHDDRYPQRWEDLEKGYSNPLDLKDWLSSVHTDDDAYYPAFELVPHERPVFEAARARVAVIQERAPPKVDKVVVMFADGHLETIRNPDRE